MYIAVAFVCLVTGECDFLVSQRAETLAQCEMRNASAHDNFDAIPEVQAYRTICIRVPDTGSHI